MKCSIVVALSAGLLGVGVGCSHDHGRVRPPVDELSDKGRGLQGKDVVSASDQMAASILSSPALNASRDQWTIVVDHVENLSSSQRGNLDIFLLRLRAKLSGLSQGRVTLIENRGKLNDLQNRELDPVAVSPDGRGATPAPPRLQPNYFLTAKLADLPSGESTYFLVDFTLTKNDRTIPWEGMYEVATGR